MRRAIAIAATVLNLCSAAFAAEPGEAKATTRLEARLNGEKWTGDLAGTLIVPREHQARVDYAVPLIPEAAGVVVTGPGAAPLGRAHG